MDVPSAVEDLALDPVVGYRVWRLAGEGTAIRLAAVTRRTLWPVLEPMRATCPQHPPGEVPGSDCMCGLYAASSLRSLERAGVMQHRTVGVLGAISMWGRVVEHSRGVRSSLAYPARVRLVCGPCLSERRGPVDPVEVVSREGRPVPLCVRHLGPQERGRPAGDVEAGLLAAYAVDLLPTEAARRGLGHRPIAAAILRRLDAAPRLPERLRTPARAVTIAATALLLTLGAISTVRPRPPEVPVDAAATAITPPVPSPVLPASRGAGALASGGTRIIRLPGVVCGLISGGGIQEVACREGPADAFGIVSAPPASRGSCDGALEWYTHGRTWSACWFVDAGAIRELRAS
jgi:hypothetical protein